jgi:hypothetical protein
VAQTANPVQLQFPTIERFNSYVHEAEAKMEQTLHAEGRFLWSEADSKRADQTLKGHIPAEFWSGKNPVEVPDGLIHDWIGATLIPGATVDDLLAIIQNYDNHKNIYKPEVIDSKLLARSDNDFQIYLRIKKKKVITVVLDTDHDVRYFSVDRARAACVSRTTRISEVEHAGTSQEQVMPADTGYGFLWRLHSYWRFQQNETGVCAECRAISLTRNIPKGLGWIIEPIIYRLPGESLINTLKATREAVLSSILQVKN